MDFKKNTTYGLKSVIFLKKKKKKKETFLEKSRTCYMWLLLVLYKYTGCFVNANKIYLPVFANHMFRIKVSTHSWSQMGTRLSSYGQNVNLKRAAVWWNLRWQYWNDTELLKCDKERVTGANSARDIAYLRYTSCKRLKDFQELDNENNWMSAETWLIVLKLAQKLTVRNNKMGMESRCVKRWTRCF